MKITKREVLASITIIAVWIGIGFFIAGKIDDWQQDANAEYDKAARIEKQDLFEHGMKTNLGNAFAYGSLEAKEPVTYPEIGGGYSYIRKEKERYTMHTRTVTYTTGSGSSRQTHTRVETYWTWDVVEVESQKSKTFIFLGNEFKSNLIDLPGSNYIDTIKESGYIRYQYYGVPKELKGTLYATLKDGTIKEGSKFYNDMTIEEVTESLEKNYWTIFFWVVWIILLGIIVYKFYYLDNDWLEG